MAKAFNRHFQFLGSSKGAKPSGRLLVATRPATLPILAFLFILASAGELSTRAQESGSESVEIAIPFSVLSSQRKPISGLGVDNFQVLVGKAPWEILSFTDGFEPLSLGILVERSQWSYKWAGGGIFSTIDGFLNAVGSEKDYFVKSYFDSSDLLIDWTTDVKRYDEVVMSMESVPTKGRRRVYDSINASIEKLAESNRRRKVLVYVGRPIDSSSKMSFRQLIEAARRSDVTVFSISLFDRQDVDAKQGLDGQQKLEALTSITGGRSHFPRSLSEVILGLRSFAEELDNQYLITINQPEAGGRWLDLSVRTLGAERESTLRGAQIRSRKGFYSAGTRK